MRRLRPGFRWVARDPRYQVNEMGVVIGPTGKSLQWQMRNKYPAISVGVAGHRNSVAIHQLVAETFIGPCPIGQEVRHMDGDRMHPYKDNLAYGTRRENNNDKKRHGTWLWRKKHGIHATA